ncbi:hypothetical protein [Gloeothece verrucosa]|uniref:ApeA N-terminal domain-containing protein n=1 Tax=Gloeothece verrucosa (strain PCC 7822) TaxID=497965 RepID=E0UBV3_GLOV7|nr:hypothetical protein [Gloeothece verrucosa]ADN15168.1 hypothetical protein Cyan7822_3216 [Gloeothece verrucosa PCC 7822]
MIPTSKQLLLQEEVVLYNNIAKIDNCEGRLMVELEIYPVPRIVWEFETIDNSNYNLPHLGQPINSCLGHLFSLNKAVITGETLSMYHFALEKRRGSSLEAIYNSLEEVAHSFTFYLTNTKFLESNQLLKLKQGQGLEQGQPLVIEFSYNQTWTISLIIKKEALEWLNPENRNRGTLITAQGEIWQKNLAEIARNNENDLPNLSLTEVKNIFNNFAWFLSYANGGYTAPLFIEGQRLFDKPAIYPVCALASQYKTTPLEQLSVSWITPCSDLEKYIERFSTFERMIQNSLWKDTFDFTLIQYFQATQHYMAWPVRASAIGAALERLSYAILVEDETNPAQKSKIDLLFDITKTGQAKQTWNLGKKPGQEHISVTGKRLRLMLERIGLTPCRGYNDINDVPEFLEVRNDAVHPRVSSMTKERRWQLIDQGIQWIDEILLWRLGYSDKYLDRSQRKSITPRYDLSLRNSSW